MLNFSTIDVQSTDVFLDCSSTSFRFAQPEFTLQFLVADIFIVTTIIGLLITLFKSELSVLRRLIGERTKTNKQNEKRKYAPSIGSSPSRLW